MTGKVQPVHSPRKLLRPCPECVVESHLAPAPWLTIEKRPGLDDHPEHLLQTQRLSAKLDLIAGIGLRPTPFVLDRKRPPQSCAARQLHTSLRIRFGLMKLYNVSLAGQTQSTGLEADPTSNNYAGPRLSGAVVDSLMKDPPLGGEPILFPLPLDVDQRPLAFAEDQVLET
jgi:hypothetical protein